ncbi:hypothetical protein S40293_10282 [Stachybotrys chartarum IBT 40293]|nr:hypothetical protein S40293_10282 [Stachybotrys chartarum IBT 40293]
MEKKIKPRSATSRALHTQEIFEMILDHLTMAECFVIQRVSIHFYKSINKSSHLQRKLFLTAAANDGRCDPRLNPLAKALFPSLFLQKQPSSWAALPPHRALTNMGWCKDAAKREKMLYPDASWRRMFPVQPPAKLKYIVAIDYDACVNCSFLGCKARLGRRLQHFQEDGLRTGILWDVVVRLHLLHPRPKTFVLWEMFRLDPPADPEEEKKQQMEEEGENYIDDGWSYCQSKHGNAGNALFNKNRALRHCISIFHAHESLCDGYDKAIDLELAVDSEFLRMVDARPKGFLDYLRKPSHYATAWPAWGTHVDDELDEETAQLSLAEKKET